MSAILLNVIVSGASISGDISTSNTPVTIEVGNSDKIGRLMFAAQNISGIYSSKLFSGNATVQVDAMLGNTVVKTLFRGTLEISEADVNISKGNEVMFTGYDYAQELLGLVSPDGRQVSPLQLSTDPNPGVVSVVSGDQGQAAATGMDLVPYVSGVLGSGSLGSITSGAQLNLFMGQYFGKSGDTTGSNSGLSFSFKPYLSGMVTWGTNPFYKTWYVQDLTGGAADTNSSYFIPYDVLKVKHEYAWDALRKITRQGYVIASGNVKVQFESYVDVSGGIHLITSGSSNFFASGLTLIYYTAGVSGAANNNVVDVKLPYSTEQLKDLIIGWFPTWTTYPLDADIYSDVVAYSGSYWSGAKTIGGVVSNATLSGNNPAPGNTPGFISIMGQNTGNNAGFPGIDLIFTLWSGQVLDVRRWNVSGGNGVTINYAVQASTDRKLADGAFNPYHNIMLIDNAGNYIIKSGTGGDLANQLNLQSVYSSGWQIITDTIYNPNGTFNSGNGQNGGWAQTAGTPGLNAIKQIVLGFGEQVFGGGTPSVLTYIIDNINFQFSYKYSPIIAFNSGAQSVYGRRYETFEYPYQATDSGAASIVLAELQTKMQSRQIGTFVVHNQLSQMNQQLSIVPGQIFIIDAPSLGTGSGQLFYYWRATQVKHAWSKTQGLETTLSAYPWFSGTSALSGLNLISASLPAPIPVVRAGQQMPATHFWTPQPPVGYK